VILLALKEIAFFPGSESIICASDRDFRADLHQVDVDRSAATTSRNERLSLSDSTPTVVVLSADTGFHQHHSGMIMDDFSDD
jgi:hypothetical protein